MNRSIRPLLDITAVRFDEENYPTKSWQLLRETTREEEKETIQIIKKLFEERPIWSRYNIGCLVPRQYHTHIKM